MEVLVFKTNVFTPKHVQCFETTFNEHPKINQWSFDIEDIDNVLRIVSSGELDEADVISLVADRGFNCSSLQS